MVRQFKRFGIDITQDPILVYPTLHYQNGGVLLDATGASTVPGLFIAGEVSGGVHGRNRLMGNSLLEICVYGRRSGRSAAEYAQDVVLGTPTLEHLVAWSKALDDAGINGAPNSPILLPDYVRHG
jgi:succinate dehydrogenase / fumarate reductase flavoprotein subunit